MLIWYQCKGGLSGCCCDSIHPFLNRGNIYIYIYVCMCINIYIYIQYMWHVLRSLFTPKNQKPRKRCQTDARTDYTKLTKKTDNLPDVSHVAMQESASLVRRKWRIVNKPRMHWHALVGWSKGSLWLRVTQTDSASRGQHWNIHW